MVLAIRWCGRFTSSGKACLAIENFNGPAVVWWGCNTGGNEEFIFKDGALCSKVGVCPPKQKGAGRVLAPNATAESSLLSSPCHDTCQNGHCLTAKATKPGGGGGGGGGDALQIWAKPQPNGATAVLVINDSAGNVTVPFDFAAVGFEAPPGIATTVLDIWTGMSSTVATGTTSFTSDIFGSHDSRFYLLSSSK